MVTRDPKWEKVRATVGHHEYDIDTNTYHPPLEIVEFRIELPFGGTFWWVSQWIHEDDLADIVPELNIYKFILDEMVERMDEYLTGKRGPND